MIETFRLFFLRLSCRRPSATWPTRLRPALECLEDRNLLAPVVTQVADSTLFPYSAVVEIESVFPGTPAGQVWEGTGTLIDSYHVLTAGHVIYNAAQGGYATSVTVYPGLNNNTAYFGSATSTKLRTFDSFIQNGTDEANNAVIGGGDVGLITLNKAVGYQTGWLTLGQEANASSYSNLSMYKESYPAENGYSGSSQYQEYAPVTGAFAGSSANFGSVQWSLNNLTAISGESGSGLYTRNALGNRTIYAVLEAATDTTGYAEQITPYVYSTLESWIGQDTLPVPAHQQGTATTLTAAGPYAVTGSPATFNAVVTELSGAGTPSGSVEFFQQNTLLGTLPLQVANGVSEATFTSTALPVGLDTITAVYEGAGSDATSASAPLTFNVTAEAPGASSDELGAYRPGDGSWSLDSNGQFGFQSGPVAGPAPLADRVVTGLSPAGQGVIPVSGDWAGIGTTEIGDFANGTWHLDVNNNGILDNAETFSFGTTGDLPVPGDYLGKGELSLAVFRSLANGAGEFLISDANWLQEALAGQPIGVADSFIFGAAGDHVVVGDWNGQGLTEVGVYRPATAFGAPTAYVWTLDIANHHAFDSSNKVFVFGAVGDGVVIGDWDGSGTSKVGVYRPATAFGAANTAVFSLDETGDFQFDASSKVFLYGTPTDKFVTGHWAYTTAPDTPLPAAALADPFSFANRQNPLALGVSGYRRLG